jgi:multidrug efflux pump subunit AcrA (membrane-fusion protein)
LLTGKKENAIVVPLAALTEEQGFYYVYVQTSGESFVKRQVVPGTNDGFRAEITNGLSVGERIVTKGAFQVKLAAMAGELPLHGHTH